MVKLVVYWLVLMTVLVVASMYVVPLLILQIALG